MSYIARNVVHLFIETSSRSDMVFATLYWTKKKKKKKEECAYTEVFAATVVAAATPSFAHKPCVIFSLSCRLADIV